MSSSPSSFLAQCLRAWIPGHYFHELLVSGSHFCSDWAVVPVVVQRQFFYGPDSCMRRNPWSFCKCRFLDIVAAPVVLQRQVCWSRQCRNLWSFHRSRSYNVVACPLCARQGVQTAQDTVGAVLGQVVACPCGARQAVGPDSAETEFPQVAVLGQGVACPLLCMPEVMVCSSDVEQIVASCHRSWDIVKVFAMWR